MTQSIYHNQPIAFATKHHKEKVIAPVFERKLGARFLIPCVDTDLLGTFSGEIERPAPALEVVEQKARLGMEISGLPLGLASEGSFGPHPSIPFIPCNREILFFVDEIRGFSLHESFLSIKTNYAYQDVSNFEEALDFLAKAQFPEHGILLYPSPWTNKDIIFKDLKDIGLIKNAFDVCKEQSPDGRVLIKTDMRSHRNPSRQKVISALARRLVHRLLTPCPACQMPGWGHVKTVTGLPCSACHTPTQEVHHDVYGCTSCDTQEISPKNAFDLFASPARCMACNP